MFGKHFASMYERSMIGSGAIVFAVWGYVIATARPDRVVGAQVTLNPVLLATILGETVAAVEGAIEFLCQPDVKSTSKVGGGRRLIKLTDFDYRVVNYARYRAIKDEETRRAQNRVAQATFRAKEKGGGKRRGGRLTRAGETGVADIEAQVTNGTMPTEPGEDGL